jgi:hypothetical protein
MNYLFSSSRINFKALDDAERINKFKWLVYKKRDISEIKPFMEPVKILEQVIELLDTIEVARKVTVEFENRTSFMLLNDKKRDMLDQWRLVSEKIFNLKTNKEIKDFLKLVKRIRKELVNTIKSGVVEPDKLRESRKFFGRMMDYQIRRLRIYEGEDPRRGFL